MRDLKKIVDEYLSSPTEYAIQIVGNWGVGKTYYYKNHLESLINTKDVFGDSSKTYKPIYISLFGLKSIEEIATKIVIEFYESKFFKKYYHKESDRKKLKITEGVLKIAFRGFLTLKGFGDINNYLTDIKNIGQNVLGTDELVLCFDDLERKDSALNITDLTGYINSLLDEKVKVLLISNDDILQKNEADYKNLKEKIIGVSVDYSVNIDSTLRDIIEAKFSSYPEYQEFLHKEINLLLEISKSANHNFRHIIYALNVLHYFFVEFRKKIFDTNHEIAKKVKEEFANIARIILAFAVEYKDSKLSFKDLETYNDYGSLFHVNLLPDSELSITEDQNTPFTMFLRKYKIRSDNYLFYESIFGYITYKDEFSLEDFVEDFKIKFHLNKGEILPQYQLATDLSPQNYFNLSDNECLKKYEEIFEFVDSGLYKPVDYLSTMFLVQTFVEIFNVDLEEGYDRLKAGLKKSIQNAGDNYEVLFDQFLGIGKSPSFSEHQNKLYDVGESEILLYKEVKKEKRIKEIRDLFLSDYTGFQNRLNTDENFQYEISEFPFIKDIEVQDLFSNIESKDNGMIVFLINFLKARYKSKGILEEEFSSISELHHLLIEHSKKLSNEKGKKVRKYLIDELAGTLSSVIEKYTPSKNQPQIQDTSSQQP